MAITQTGYTASFAMTVREEVLETSFAFQSVGTGNSTLGTRSLADELARISFTARFTSIFGTDVTFQRIKVSPIGFGDGWSWEIPLFNSGTGQGVAISEVNHVRINLVSALEEGERKVNRNQLMGCDSTEITDGKVSSDLAQSIFFLLESFSDGSLSTNGFTFVLACKNPTPAPVQVPEFRTVVQYNVPTFVGTRIDRVLNRPNTGRKPAADPIAESLRKENEELRKSIAIMATEDKPTMSEE